MQLNELSQQPYQMYLPWYIVLDIDQVWIMTYMHVGACQSVVVQGLDQAPRPPLQDRLHTIYAVCAVVLYINTFL